MQGKRTGHAPRDGLVSEMDPDAVNRGDGAGLAADDAVSLSFCPLSADPEFRFEKSYEKSLLQALYGYIRAGRLGDAVEICRRAHQPWRAASIRGSLLFQWKTLCERRLSTLCFDPDYVPPSASERKLDDVSSDDEMDEDLESWSGNRSRRLWKATCVQAALSVCTTTPASRSFGHSSCGFSLTSAIKNGSCSLRWHQRLKQLQS